MKVMGLGQVRMVIVPYCLSSSNEGVQWSSYQRWRQLHDMAKAGTRVDTAVKRHANRNRSLVAVPVKI